MIRRDLSVECSNGVEGETATRLISIASGFSSSINIESGEKKANAKSLLGVLALRIKKGDRITIDVNGKDEVQASIEIEKSFS